MEADHIEFPPKTPNEIINRMLGAGLDPEEHIEDVRLRKFINRVGSTPGGVLNPDYLRKQYGILDGHQAKSEQDPSIKGYDDGELASVLGILGGWIEDLDAQVIPATPQQGGQPLAREFAQALADVLHEAKLSPEEKYKEFQDDEQWNSTALQPVNPDNPPSYYISMTVKERNIHQARIELANAALFKRSKLTPPNLDSLSKNEIATGISKSETQMLYEIPGVKEILSMYVDLIDNNLVLGIREDDSEITVLSARNRDELLQIRERIRVGVGGIIAHEYNIDPENAETKRRSRDAEQIAFNLLYLGNTFESLDSQWENGVRSRGPQCSSEFTSIPIRNAMRPMDALIGSLKKGPNALAEVGKFGEWAYSNAIDSNHGNPLTNIDYVLIADEDHKEDAKKFWTVKGDTLYVPECYPVRLVGSIWEETMVNVAGVDRPLIDYIRAGKAIPWGSVQADDMWEAYNGKLGKSQVIVDYLQGRKPIKWGDIDSIKDWITEISNALAKFGVRDSVHIKRWALYASTGTNLKKREPRLITDKTYIRKIAGNDGNKVYLNNNELFFPWDGEGIMKFLS